VETVAADGSNPVQVYTTSRGTYGPTFSPDGTLLVFGRESGGSRRDLWVMNADGSNLTRLTDTERKNETSPSWQST